VSHARAIELAAGIARPGVRLMRLLWALHAAEREQIVLLPR
jgi:hypothetical protein